MPRQSISPSSQEVKRPSNAWILYRSDAVRNLPPVGPGESPHRQAEVTKKIANQWNQETEEVKRDYYRKAEAAKADHKRTYPDYVYKPAKKGSKRKMGEMGADRVEEIAQEVMRTLRGNPPNAPQTHTSRITHGPATTFRSPSMPFEPPSPSPSRLPTAPSRPLDHSLSHMPNANPRQDYSQEPNYPLEFNPSFHGPIRPAQLPHTSLTNQNFPALQSSSGFTSRGRGTPNPQADEEWEFDHWVTFDP